MIDPDVKRRLLSVAQTLETCGKHGIPISFHQLAHDIRSALAGIETGTAETEGFGPEGMKAR